VILDTSTQQPKLQGGGEQVYSIDVGMTNAQVDIYFKLVGDAVGGI